MVAFLVLTSVTFSLFGFIIGIWASGWEKLQIIPIMVVTPLTFLGGSFYSISMLPPLWQKLSLFNPVVYLINGFRWSFYGIADVASALSLGMTLLFMVAVPAAHRVDLQDRLPHQDLTLTAVFPTTASTATSDSRRTPPGARKRARRGAR